MPRTTFQVGCDISIALRETESEREGGIKRDTITHMMICDELPRSVAAVRLGLSCLDSTHPIDTAQARSGVMR